MNDYYYYSGTNMIKLEDKSKDIDLNNIFMDEQYTFYQEPDCCDVNDQTLVIKTQNGGIADSDKFYVLETGRWAFETIDELITLLKKAHIRKY